MAEWSDNIPGVEFGNFNTKYMCVHQRLPVSIHIIPWRNTHGQNIKFHLKVCNRLLHGGLFCPFASFLCSLNFSGLGNDL